jgi:malic enzyme
MVFRRHYDNVSVADLRDFSVDIEKHNNNNSKFDISKNEDIKENIAPTFGGINLEDISAPRCFEIEQRLIAELDIPVFHDDQHGTANLLRVNFNIKHINISKFFKQNRLTLHHWF